MEKRVIIGSCFIHQRWRTKNYIQAVHCVHYVSEKKKRGVSSPIVYFFSFLIFHSVCVSAVCILYIKKNFYLASPFGYCFFLSHVSHYSLYDVNNNTELIFKYIKTRPIRNLNHLAMTSKMREILFKQKVKSAVC